MTDFKESVIGDHLYPAYSPRLRKLGVKGSNVKHIAPKIFAGISSKHVDISLEVCHPADIVRISTQVLMGVKMEGRAMRIGFSTIDTESQILLKFTEPYY